MPSIEILYPRLHGRRFDNGEIPLEVIGDLAALQQMVIDVAKWRFYEENPYRQRIPRGFISNIDLKLTDIRSGSAVPVIGLSSERNIYAESLHPFQRFYEQAVEYIVDAISAAYQDRHPTLNGRLPNRYFAHFARIGRSLRDGEYIEFCLRSGKVSAPFTPYARNRLVAMSRENELMEEVNIRGFIPEADQDKMTFELQPIFGSKVTGPIPEHHCDTIIEAFSGYGNGARVAVRGVGRLNHRNRLIRLESIEKVDLLDPLDIPARLDEFRNINNGWINGGGFSPNHNELDWLSARFERYFPDDLPLPYIFPTPEGNIEVEWSIGRCSIIFEIDLDSRQGDWLRFDKQSDEEDARFLDLDDDGKWKWVVSEIRRLVELAE